MALNLQDFGISETIGFALENPLAKLPDYFEPWNQLAADMPQLVANSTMRERIQQMPLLDWTRLTDHRQQRLAHLQLGIMAAGYVWQDGNEAAAKVLPSCVAVPLCAVSQQLGVVPILNYASLVLANYRPCDPAKPLELENLSTLYCLPGRKEADWFIVISVAIELAFVKSIKHVLVAVEGGKRGEEETVTSSLVHLTQFLSDMQMIFSRIHEKLSAATFFSKLMPFLQGWGGKDNPLPDGLIYEGVSDKPMTAIGGSAAQSGTIQVLDALLGVQHSPEKTSYLLTLQSYMLPGHRRFIEDIEKQSRSLQSMIKSSTNDDLIQAYNNLLSALICFRSYHIQIVTKYTVQSASQAKQADTFDSLVTKGTGRTDLLPFLKELRQDTRDCLLTPHSSCNGAD